MNNLHVTMTPFRYESRVLKETASLVRSGMVDHVCIAALQEKGLPEHETIDGSREVWRVRLASRGLPRVFLLQIFKYLELCLRLLLRARSSKVGLVNIHSVDLLPLGVFLKWLLRAKLVYDTHELETERKGLAGLRRAVARRIERMFIRYADLVIVVGGGIGDWYRGKYGLGNIAAVLNCPEYRDPQRTGCLREELGIPEGKRIVIYQGGLAGGRGVELLLEAFAGGDDGRHVLVFMGYGELEPLVRKYAALHGNIYLKEAVEPAKVLLYASSADVGISYIENDCMSYNLCLPNKLFEYIMAGLPVIVNDLPEMRRVVEECGIGVVISELTRQSLAAALGKIDRMDPGILKGNLERAASAYSWRNQERVMIEAYKEHVRI